MKWFRTQGSAQRKRHADDSGFTLVELLIVLVILPMVLGAATFAVVTTLVNDNNIKNRLSDSANAQLASSYYVRDIQGATLLTTDRTPTDQPYGASGTRSLPVLCPALSALTYGTPTLVIGIYRATLPSPASISYWVTSGTASRKPQIVRQYCTITIPPGTAAYTPTAASTVMVSDDVIDANQGTAIISPSAINTAAQSGWVPTAVSGSAFVNFSHNSTTQTLPFNGVTFTVTPSAAGFVAGVPMQVATSAGAQTMTCTGAPGNPIAGCSSTGTGTISQGALISQQAVVSGVTFTTDQPASSYNVNLLGSPRTGSSTAGNNGKGASLLTLGGGTTIGLSGGSTVNVNGGVAMNDGTLSCTNNSSFSASGGIQTTTGNNGASSAGCNLSPPLSAWGEGPVSDPYLGKLPAPFPEPPASQRYNNPSSYNSAVTLQPGEYLNQLQLTSGAIVTLTPGVYVLDCGLAVNSNSSTLQVAANVAGDGVLLYIPDHNTDHFGICSGGGNPDGAVSMNGGSSTVINLTPLSQAQSDVYFSSYSNPAAATGLWVWQNVNDSSGASLGGTGAAEAFVGTAYLPGANVTLSGGSGLTVGRVIAASVSFTGGNATTITGQ